LRDNKRGGSGIGSKGEKVADDIEIYSPEEEAWPMRNEKFLREGGCYAIDDEVMACQWNPIIV
jgi:hypothetical protein